MSNSLLNYTSRRHRRRHHGTSSPRTCPSAPPKGREKPLVGIEK